MNPFALKECIDCGMLISENPTLVSFTQAGGIAARGQYVCPDCHALREKRNQPLIKIADTLEEIRDLLQKILEDQKSRTT